MDDGGDWYAAIREAKNRRKTGQNEVPLISKEMLNMQLCAFIHYVGMHGHCRIHVLNPLIDAR